MRLRVIFLPSLVIAWLLPSFLLQVNAVEGAHDLAVYDNLVKRTISKSWDKLPESAAAPYTGPRNLFALLEFESIENEIKGPSLELLRNRFSQSELGYLANSYANPALQKFLSLLEEHNDRNVALSNLSKQDREFLQTPGNIEFDEQTNSKFEQYMDEVFVLFVEATLQNLENKKQQITKLTSIKEMREVCEKYYQAKAYNSAFVSCAAPHFLGDLESSKIYARMIWRGEYLPRNIPKALEVYKGILRTDSDLESMFYYGALNFNFASNERDKNLAACWIGKAATEGFSDANSFYDGIKDDYPKIHDNCEYIGK